MVMPKGFKHSQETRIKMSKSHLGLLKGKISPLRGKKRPNISKGLTGKKLSEEHKKNLSLALKSRKFSKEHKRNLSLARKKFLKRNNKLSKETKRKMTESRIKFLCSGKIKLKDTKIEQKIEEELKQRNIYYQKQVPLCKVTIVDFYLPKTRTVIYCDGDYWHSKPERKSKDINQDVILTFNGFNVYRFTETEINKSAKRCINKILNFVRGESTNGLVTHK
jgi:very-short-patch-repair endonuclease